MYIYINTYIYIYISTAVHLSVSFSFFACFYCMRAQRYPCVHIAANGIRMSPSDMRYKSAVL